MDKPADPIVFGPEYDPLARPRTPQAASSPAPVASEDRIDEPQLLGGRTERRTRFAARTRRIFKRHLDSTRTTI